MLNKRIKNFFLGSIISAVAICIVVFGWAIAYMRTQTEHSVKEISEIYMAEVSRQIQQKFDSIMALRLDQVQGIIQRSSPEDVVYGDRMFAELSVSAEVRGFSYLALYSENGVEEKIVGKDLDIVSYHSLLDSLAENGQGIAMAADRNGEQYLMLAKSAAYPLKSGKKSVALVAGVSMQYLKDALFLNEENALVHSHVIAEDGTFVIRSNEEFGGNYFARLHRIVEELDGKTADDYEKELKEAIQENKTYATLILAEGERRNMFCAPISDDMEWYVISVMPSGALNQRLGELDVIRLMIMISSAVVIFIMMLVIFILYYRLSIQQMKELDKKECAAVRASRAKSEFLSSMSHDIRTPMNAIIGMTEIALHNLADAARVEDCLQKVRLSSKHLLGLINDVLDMSKIESGKMTLNISQMSLRETMDDIVNIMQPQVKERSQYFDIFIRDIEEENVYCDAVRLNQVLLNLLSNAVKFTPEKGRIDVHLYQEPSPKGEGYIQTHFIVEDNGIGMSEEFQKKIFDTFSRDEANEKVQKTVGTGLGMSITKSIVSMMGGSIGLKSEQGKGSVFHITLDLQKAGEAEDEMVLPDWNILVVDDNEMLCLSAVANLEALGAHADWTQDGRQVVDMIEAHHNRNEDYHFVLIDWKMPNMDGIQTIQEIHHRVGNDIPIFLISAYDWSELEAQVSDAKIEGFISKPLFKSTLFTRLRQYAQGEDEKTQPDSEEIYFEGKHVLLAEDIEINWEIANEIFSGVGLILEWAENGQECVDKFQASEIGFYDAILMDVRMPVMNGYDATRAIRALGRADSSLPIIAMTADAFADDAQRCFESGMDDHLTKPLDIRECMRTFQKYFK